VESVLPYIDVQVHCLRYNLKESLNRMSYQKIEVEVVEDMEILVYLDITAPK